MAGPHVAAGLGEEGDHIGAKAGGRTRRGGIDFELDADGLLLKAHADAAWPAVSGQNDSAGCHHPRSRRARRGNGSGDVTSRSVPSSGRKRDRKLLSRGRCRSGQPARARPGARSPSRLAHGDPAEQHEEAKSQVTEARRTLARHRHEQAGDPSTRRAARGPVRPGPALPEFPREGGHSGRNRSNGAERVKRLFNFKLIRPKLVRQGG